MVLQELASVIRLDGHLVFLSDHSGRLLWSAGTAGARRAAEAANLVPGVSWDENTVGTNGVGTVLALGCPYQVRGREHFYRKAQAFTCSAAPIRDHTHDRMLGVLDVTAPAGSTNELTMTVVAQAARIAEANLRRDMLERDLHTLRRFSDRVSWHSGQPVALIKRDGSVLRASPPGWLPRLPAPVQAGVQSAPNGRQVDVEPLTANGPYLVVGVSAEPTTLRVRIGDRSHASVTLGASRHDLSARQTDLLRALLTTPAGLSAGEIAAYLYGDATKVSSARGEITRLRRILGNRLRSGPYRVIGRVDSDLRARSCFLNG